MFRTMCHGYAAARMEIFILFNSLGLFNLPPPARPGWRRPTSCWALWHLKPRHQRFSRPSVSHCLYILQDTASLGSQKGGISKHGWLYKGNMNSAISVTMRVRHTATVATFRTKIIHKLSHYLICSILHNKCQCLRICYFSLSYMKQIPLVFGLPDGRIQV